MQQVMNLFVVFNCYSTIVFDIVFSGQHSNNTEDTKCEGDTNTKTNTRYTYYFSTTLGAAQAGDKR